MKHPLQEMMDKRRQGIRCGIPSYCSANELVIEIALRRAKERNIPVLIEATANQVNQFGGYTGMKPADFYQMVLKMAKDIDLPENMMILAGDHLGPLTWQKLPEAEAMKNSVELVYQYARAGFTKIHLDTSMKVADDAPGLLKTEVIARRGAQLYKAAMKGYEELKAEKPDAMRPVFVIGSEVPIPGGATEAEDTLAVTSPDAFRDTVSTYQRVWTEEGVGDGMKDVIAVVVQPGVEFGDEQVFDYDPAAAVALCAALKEFPDICFEGHSTDYQTAADLASDEQDASKVSSFLKATITVDDATGETAVVSDYVAQKALENLESYAAIETRFDELGGVLTPDEETQADSYASQLMEQNGDLYKANGIGLDTLKRFERILIKSNDLLEKCYGTDGETPVSDAELTSHLEDEMVYIRYVVVPLYNTSTFAFADDDQSAQMLELAQTAVESYNAATPDGASAQTSAFSAAVTAALPDIYAVLDSEPSSDASSLSTALLGSDNIDATFSEEGTADAVRALKPGEAAAVQYSSYALMMLVRLDPLDADTLDSLRAQALSDMKSSELQDSIQSFGASLPHALDTAAMKKLPASKIKNTQSDQ